MQYSIAEIFTSIQGEGPLAGTPTTFIRLAGCNVGQYPSAAHDFSVCTTALNDQFMCDTNYRRKENLSIREIRKQVKVPHVCITGGEPFLHNLEPLINELGVEHISIETSGTRMPFVLDDYDNWLATIVCSPKKGYLKDFTSIVDAFKFLVHAGHTPEYWVDKIGTFLQDNGVCQQDVYIGAVNDIHSIDKGNMFTALEVLKLRPDWKLNAQLHKFLQLP